MADLTRDYTHANWQVFINNVPVARLNSVNVNETMNATNNHGFGTVDPVSRGFSEKNGEGTIELEVAERAKIAVFSPTGSLLDIYLNTANPLLEIRLIGDNKTGVGGIIRQVIKNVSFTSDGFNLSVGDTRTVFSHSFTFSGIEYL